MKKTYIIPTIKTMPLDGEPILAGSLPVVNKPVSDNEEATEEETLGKKYNNPNFWGE